MNGEVADVRGSCVVYGLPLNVAYRITVYFPRTYESSVQNNSNNNIDGLSMFFSNKPFNTVVVCESIMQDQQISCAVFSFAFKASSAQFVTE